MAVLSNNLDQQLLSAEVEKKPGETKMFWDSSSCRPSVQVHVLWFISDISD